MAPTTTTTTPPLHVVLERGQVPVASCDVVHAGAVLPVEIVASKTGSLYPATPSLFVACRLRAEHVFVLRGADLDASTRAHVWCFQPTAPPRTLFVVPPATASAIYKSLPPDHALKRDALARTELECWAPRPIAAAAVADRGSTSPSLSISPKTVAVPLPPASLLEPTAAAPSAVPKPALAPTNDPKSDSTPAPLSSSESGASGASGASSASGASDVSGEDSESDASVVADSAASSCSESESSDAPRSVRKRAAPSGRRGVPLAKRAALAKRAVQPAVQPASQPVPQPVPQPVLDVTAALAAALPARLTLVSKLVGAALASGARERVLAAESALSAAVRALV